MLKNFRLNFFTYSFHLLKTFSIIKGGLSQLKVSSFWLIQNPVIQNERINHGRTRTCRAPKFVFLVFNQGIWPVAYSVPLLLKWECHPPPDPSAILNQIPFLSELIIVDFSFVYSAHLHLSPFLYPQNSHNQDIPFIQEVMWSSLPSALVFVYENNIFYKPEAISNSVIFQITYTGSNYVFNGVPDWLYQGKCHFDI